MQDQTLFDGVTISPQVDDGRLTILQGRVYSYLRSHDWVTLRQLSEACRGTETSVSARIRDLRKPRWGEHEIQACHASGDGVWRYKMISSKQLLDGRSSGPSPKKAARERIKAYIEERNRNQLAGDVIAGANGSMLTMSDLKEMLR
jgi:hypothetical protein